MVYAVVKFVIFALRVKITDYDLILAIERRNPSLKEKLISAYQFKELLKDPNYKDSRELSEQVIQEADQLIPQIDFSMVIKIGKPILLSFLALLLCGGWTAAWVYSPKVFAHWFQRGIRLQNIRWPKRTELFVIRETFHVEQNKKIKICVHLRSSANVKELVLRYRSRKRLGLIWQEIPLLKKGKNFEATLPGIKKITYFYLQVPLEEEERKKMKPIQLKDTFAGLYILIPKNQGIHSIDMDFPNHYRVKPGGKVSLEAIAVGKMPKEAFIHYQIQGGEWTTDEIEKKERKIKVGKKMIRTSFFMVSDIINIASDHFLYFDGGQDKDKWPLYYIQVTNAPRVNNITAWYVYPEYVSKSGLVGPKDVHGVVKEIVGTKTFLRITPNIPVAEGEIYFYDLKDKLIQTIPLQNSPPHPSIKGEKGEFYASFILREKANAVISLVAQTGVEEKVSYKFYIRPAQDRAPYIRFVEPKRKNIQMTSQGVLDLKISAQDDYGIKRLDLRYKINVKGDWHTIPLVINKKPKRKQEATYQIKLRNLRAKRDDKQDGAAGRLLAKGDTVIIKVIGKDNNFIAPSVGESKLLTINILDKMTLSKFINRELQIIKNELVKLLQKQKDIHIVVRDIINTKGKVERRIIPRISELIFAQKAIGNRIFQLGNHIDQIIATIDRNNILDAYTRADILFVRNRLRAIYTEHKTEEIPLSKQVVEKLRFSYRKLLQKSTDTKSYLKEASQKQDVIEKYIQECIRKLSEWEDLNDVVRDIEGLLQMHKNLEPKLKKMAPKRN